MSRQTRKKKKTHKVSLPKDVVVRPTRVQIEHYKAIYGCPPEGSMDYYAVALTLRPKRIVAHKRKLREALIRADMKARRSK